MTGILGIVVAFAVFTIAASLFREADIPKRLSREASRARSAGEGYGVHDDALPAPDKSMREHAEPEGFDVIELEAREPEEARLPPFALAIAPVVLVILVNLLSIKVLIPALDTDFLSEAVLGLGGDNPLISLAVAVNVLAGMTGSASGGMSIALDTLGATYVALANEAGVPLDLMHRVTSVATGGLDSLPHNGAVITLLAITGLGHREAYKDIFVVAVLIPILPLILLIVLGTLFGAF